MPHALLDLPHDVLIAILAQLDLLDLMAAEQTARTLSALIHKTALLQFRKLQLSYGTSPLSIRGTSSSEKLANLRTRQDAWANLRFKPHVEYRVRPSISHRRLVLSGDHVYAMRFDGLVTRFTRMHLPSGTIDPDWFAVRAPSEENVIHMVFDQAQDLFVCVQQNWLDEDRTDTCIYCRSTATGKAHPEASKTPHVFGEGYDWWNARPIRLSGPYIVITVDRFSQEDAIVIINWKTGQIIGLWTPPPMHSDSADDGFLIAGAAFIAQRTVLVHWGTFLSVISFPQAPAPAPNNQSQITSLRPSLTLVIPDSATQLKFLNTCTYLPPEPPPLGDPEADTGRTGCGCHALPRPSRPPFDDDVVVFDFLRASSPGPARNLLVLDRADLLALARAPAVRPLQLPCQAFASTPSPTRSPWGLSPLARAQRPTTSATSTSYQTQDQTPSETDSRDQYGLRRMPWAEWTARVRTQVVPIDTHGPLVDTLRASGNRVAYMEHRDFGRGGGAAGGNGPEGFALTVHDFRRFVRRREGAGEDKGAGSLRHARNGTVDRHSISTAGPHHAGYRVPHHHSLDSHSHQDYGHGDDHPSPSPSPSHDPSFILTMTDTWAGGARLQPHFPGPARPPRAHCTLSRVGYPTRGLDNLMFNDQWFVLHGACEEDGSTVIHVYALDVP